MSIFSTAENAGITKNLAYALFAQGVGFISSAVMSLLLPKILGVDQYGYWQMILLYSSYSGILLFGINDGIYLRLGGKKYNELPFEELKSQLIIIFLFQTFVAIIALIWIYYNSFGTEKFTVGIFVILAGFLLNCTSCLSFIFQSTNLTQIASISTTLSKSLFLLSVVVIILSSVVNYRIIAALYCCSLIVSFVYCLICARQIIKRKMIKMGNMLSICKEDCIAGSKVMVAYYADSLIVGFSRMTTEWFIGLRSFASLSLSFSIMGFFLTFIGQVAMVAFPILKRFEEGGQREKYVDIRAFLHVTLPIILLFYLPAKWLITWWLPEYANSLKYLALAMPLCLYSSKTSLLFNTYLKINRDEGYLCKINVLIMIFSMLLSVIATYVLASLSALAIGIVIAVAVRDLVYEHHFAIKYGLPYKSFVTQEFFLSIVFMICFSINEPAFIFFFYISMMFYYLLNIKDVKRIVRSLKQRLRVG